MSTETPEPSDGIGADAEAAIDARLGAAGAGWRAAQPAAARVDSAMFRPAPARSGWLVAAAAASVVLIAGGVFVATRGAGGPTGSAEPAGPFSWRSHHLRRELLLRSRATSPVQYLGALGRVPRVDCLLRRPPAWGL